MLLLLLLLFVQEGILFIDFLLSIVHAIIISSTTAVFTPITLTLTLTIPSSTTTRTSSDAGMMIVKIQITAIRSTLESSLGSRIANLLILILVRIGIGIGIGGIKGIVFVVVHGSCEGCAVNVNAMFMFMCVHGFYATGG
jgi:hypothetical protein